MGERTKTRSTAVRDDGLEVLETELAVLARTLEGLSRRSAVYRDLDRASYLIARVLVAEGPGSINELARRLGLDATTVTRQVSTMEAGGLVHRGGDPQDGRVSLIEISALGKRRMREVRAAREERINHLLESWPEADRRRFGELLARFNDAIRADAPVRAGGRRG